MKIIIEGENIKCSDGFHTFEELYEHRIVLFMQLCRFIRNQYPIWMSEYHFDGSNYDGWFIMGIDTEKGKQISYHFPMKYHDECASIVHRVLPNAPEWDGHTSNDVLKRLREL